MWFPLFAPIEGAEDAPVTDLVPPPVVEIRPPASTERYEHKVAITGIGQSQVGRRLMRPPVSLTVDACHAAVADAGLRCPTSMGSRPGPAAWVAAAASPRAGSRSSKRRSASTRRGTAAAWRLRRQTGIMVNAMLAVASGLCRHVLCFRTVWEATNTELLRTGQLPLPKGGAVGGDFQWRIPFGSTSAAQVDRECRRRSTSRSTARPARCSAGSR